MADGASGERFASARRAPCTDGFLMHCASPRGEKSGLGRPQTARCLGNPLAQQIERRLSRQDAHSVAISAKVKLGDLDAGVIG